MKLGLYGLPGAGRKTIFEALSTGLKAQDDQAKAKRQARMTVVQVPDSRLAPLNEMFNPQKLTPARITVIIPDEAAPPTQVLAELSGLDGLIFVLANYEPSTAQPTKDLAALEDELILRDLGVAEGVYERMLQGKKKGLEVSAEEKEAMARVIELLNAGQPIREDPELASFPPFKSYAFLSAKPRLIAVNNAEGENDPPDLGRIPEEPLVLQGLIEQELAQMDEAEAEEFRSEYGLAEPGLNRVVRAAYSLMDLISFFTVGEDEVRAWTVQAGSPAPQAAGVIHTDLEKGFIRAEVVTCDELLEAGSLAEVRNRGQLRLEGKDYTVVDGDVINVRFNV